MTKKRITYKEGDIFGIPLDQDKGFGVVLVARCHKSHGGVLGYFLGPAKKNFPTLSDYLTVKAKDSILIGIFGDLYIIQGKWKYIGSLPDWNKKDWPMPIFGRYNEVDDEAFLIEYDDEDPNNEIREVKCSRKEIEGLPEDRLMGAGAAEIHLTRALLKNK